MNNYYSNLPEVKNKSFAMENINVYNLQNAVIASGLAKSVDGEPAYNEKRAIALGNAITGSGHDCFLKGILVAMDITAPQYWWMQFQRYHFADIITSQSKMHKILEFDLEEQCNKYVLESTKGTLNLLKTQYELEGKNIEFKTEVYNELLANTPMGLMLKAQITTNYLQLKTMYGQRYTHKLKNEWGVFCNQLKKFPKFKEFCLK